MRHIETAEGVSYTAAVFSILSSLTLNQIAALVGIITAVLTALFSVWHSWRRDMREEARRREEAEEHRLRVREMNGQCGRMEASQ